MKKFAFYESRSSKTKTGKYFKNPLYVIEAESKEKAWELFNKEDRGVRDGHWVMCVEECE